MLVSLHVKNLALIQESEVMFGPGLNILTGETGAGKSILIGSVSLALGAKADKDLIRSGAEYALVELVFQSDAPELLQRMKEMDIPVEEDGTIIISRKIQAARSVSKINGETVTARQIKELAELLIDIHGQHEHQSLLHKKKHMEILDAYAGEELEPVLAQISACYGDCRQLREKIETENLDENARKREIELTQFEWQEIDAAALKPGEDEELESRYRKMVNGKKIGQALAGAYQGTGYDSEQGAGGQIGRALRELRSVASYDEALGQLESQLLEIDSLLNDFNRDLSEYMEDLEFDESDFRMVEERLNLLNHLKGKYGGSLEKVLAYGEECESRLEKLEDYETYMEKLRTELSQKEKELYNLCGTATKVRKQHGAVLQEVLKKALEDLNFLSVQFEIAITGKEPGATGADEVEFMISTNPGESLKPLVQVASGGELSRIMLAIKTVLADKDAVDTMIFDEIDAGISGKTAWKVAEKLGTLGNAHQVICITHLAQIAAMADTHFVIEKDTDGQNTVTEIRQLREEEALGELARLLGSDGLSQAALSNAKEMRTQALSQKGK